MLKITDEEDGSDHERVLERRPPGGIYITGSMLPIEPSGLC
jgi:hypothetical protein